MTQKDHLLHCHFLSHKIIFQAKLTSEISRFPPNTIEHSQNTYIKYLAFYTTIFSRKNPEE